MSKKRALILGITGQDGSYLAELLLGKGYEVHGLYRRTSLPNTGRIYHLLDRLTLHRGDLSDPMSVDWVVRTLVPDEVYNLADQDHIGWSLFTPAYSADVTAGAVGRLLDSCANLEKSKGPVKVFQALSATMFGDTPPPQNEASRVNPMSPYACAKTHAYHLCRYYRSLDLSVSTCIFFNHDSPRRGPEYLLHRICRGAAQVRADLDAGRKLWADTLYGPEDEVDIGFAGDYVEAAWLALQKDEPSDYVIGTGLGTKVKDLVGYAGRYFNLPDEVEGWLDFGEPKSKNLTPALRADFSKAKTQLGWNPRMDLVTLVRIICARYAAELNLTRYHTVG